MGKKEMGIGSKIVYWILLGLCKFVGLLPTWFLYHCLLDAIYFFVYKVCRYRVRIVRENLELAFPEKNAAERRGIEKRFYYHLAEVMVDTIDFMSITPAQARKRLVIDGFEEHERSVDGGNWIAALAHYGSWEYFAAYPLFTQSATASAYHPLHNKAVDRLMLESRSRFGMQLVPMYDLGRFVARHKDAAEGNYALGMIIDQSPSRRSAYVWVRFLGQPTRFFTGVEKFAIKYNLKVYFFHMEKPARARYHGHFEMIYDGREQVGEGEIVSRYARRLEEQVRARPELWMWSHRRWKRPASEEIREKMDAGAGIVASETKNR